MSRLPDALDLLSTAYDVLAKKITPALPEKLRYDALMVGNALRIALRELGENAIDSRATLIQERELAAAIRCGEHDDDPEVAKRLRKSIVSKLRISNPKALAEAACRK